jgi:hypothetical protein
MRNLLEEFHMEHGFRYPTILGVREHVFTGRFSISLSLSHTHTHTHTQKTLCVSVSTDEIFISFILE